MSVALAFRKRWPAGDLEKIARLAEALAQAANAREVIPAHAQAAERTYISQQTTELRWLG